MRQFLYLLALACAVASMLAVALPNCTGDGAFHEFHFGEFLVTVLSDGDLVMPNEPFKIGKEIVHEEYKKLNMSVPPYRFPQNVVVLRRGPHTILIDSGSFTPSKLDPLVENMKKAGIAPHSVTHILLTHGHFDHVGGLVDDSGSAVYPNAHVYISKKEYIYWAVDARAELNRIVRPAAEENVNDQLVDTFAKWLPPYRKVLVPPNYVPLPGITFTSTPGHTYYHMAIVVRSQEKTLFIAGDMVMGKASNLRHPEWAMKIESNPERAIKTRNEMLATLARTGFLTILYHEAFPGVGTVVVKDGKYDWKPSKESEAIVKNCRGRQ